MFVLMIMNERFFSMVLDVYPELITLNVLRSFIRFYKALIITF